MKLLVDMNLSPKWCSVLQAEGWDTVHWSDVGTASAPDPVGMRAWLLNLTDRNT
jgi:predicted nuclease of predicted toxin-antitoxin system